jgi:2-amino-4-hydroxy-6-hydroxymethyldihydropteridine diphosphokinase
VNALVFPSWTQASDRRRAHIERVVSLLMQWADALDIPKGERETWHSAGLLHDALRDAPDRQLREMAKDPAREPELLHGPAVANVLEADGVTNASLLRAIRFHTVGSPEWDRAGRALYMADFLEPGRGFARRDRHFLAMQVPHDFDGVFRQVLRARLEYALREGYTLFPETVALWNTVR